MPEPGSNTKSLILVWFLSPMTVAERTQERSAYGLA